MCINSSFPKFIHSLFWIAISFNLCNISILHIQPCDMKVCVILVIHKKFITSQIFFYRWYHHAIEILCPALFFVCFIYYHKSVFHVRTRKSFVAEWFAQPLIKCGMTVLIFLYLKKIIEIKMYGLQLFPGA